MCAGLKLLGELLESVGECPSASSSSSLFRGAGRPLEDMAAGKSP